MNIAAHTIESLLGAIAAKQPTPGGGAVAAITLGLGAALAEMTINYSLGKKSLAEHVALHERTLALATSIRSRALELADADADAYKALNAAMRRKDEPEGAAAMQNAVRGAIDVPMQVLRHSAELSTALANLAGTTNAFLDSDLAMAAILSEAAAQSACWNVRINLPELALDADRTAIANDMRSLLEQTVTSARSVQELLRK